MGLTNFSIDFILNRRPVTSNPDKNQPHPSTLQHEGLISFVQSYFSETCTATNANLSPSHPALHNSPICGGFSCNEISFSGATPSQSTPLTNMASNTPPIMVPCTVYPHIQRVPPSRMLLQAAAANVRRSTATAAAANSQGSHERDRTLDWNYNHDSYPNVSSYATDFDTARKFDAVGTNKSCPNPPSTSFVNECQNMSCYMQQISGGEMLSGTRAHGSLMAKHMQRFYGQQAAIISPSSSSNGWSRAVFSNLQRKGLERSFRTQSYISRRERQKLAAALGLSENQVRIWFANRRMKDKKVAKKKSVKKLQPK